MVVVVSYKDNQGKRYIIEILFTFYLIYRKNTLQNSQRILTNMHLSSLPGQLHLQLPLPKPLHLRRGEGVNAVRKYLITINETTLENTTCRSHSSLLVFNFEHNKIVQCSRNGICVTKCVEVVFDQSQARMCKYILSFCLPACSSNSNLLSNQIC
jgi:hypothetical protein